MSCGNPKSIYNIYDKLKDEVLLPPTIIQSYCPLGEKRWLTRKGGFTSP